MPRRRDAASPGGVDVRLLAEAVQLIDGAIDTEASGNITLETVGSCSLRVSDETVGEAPRERRVCAAPVLLRAACRLASSPPLASRTSASAPSRTRWRPWTYPSRSCCWGRRLHEDTSNRRAPAPARTLQAPWFIHSGATHPGCQQPEKESFTPRLCSCPARASTAAAVSSGQEVLGGGAASAHDALPAASSARPFSGAGGSPLNARRSHGDQRRAPGSRGRQAGRDGGRAAVRELLGWAGGVSSRRAGQRGDRGVGR